MNWKHFGSAPWPFKKPQFSLCAINWEKVGSIHSPRPTFENPNFESIDESGIVMS